MDDRAQLFQKAHSRPPLAFVDGAPCSYRQKLALQIKQSLAQSQEAHPMSQLEDLLVVV